MPQDVTVMLAEAAGTAAALVCPTGVASCGIAADTSVMTARGGVAAGLLMAGDRVITRNGMRRVTAVDRRAETGQAIRIRASALGHDRPEADVIVAAGQPLHLRDWRAAALYGSAVASVPAARLADGEYIRSESVSALDLVTLRFEAPCVIYAAGLEIACA
jgi:Hint domain